MSRPRLTQARALALLKARREAANGSPSSVLLEQRQLRRVLPRLEVSLQRATREAVERWLAARLGEVAATTAAHELRSLRALYRLLLAEGLVTRDPTQGVEPTQGEHERLVLSESQVERLLSEASRVQPAHWGRSKERVAALALRDRAALELLYSLGLRASELCRARLVELDLADGVLRVERAKRGPPAALTLPPSALAHVERYVCEGRAVLLARHGEARTGGRVLVNERGRYVTVTLLEQLVAKVAARAELRAHPHALRRSLATHLVQGGARLVAVQRLLGHASLRTTQAYVQLDLRDLRASVEKLDRG